MIQVTVSRTFLVEGGDHCVVLLNDRENQRALPIAIGPLEAQSIAIVLNNLALPRPLTHELFKLALGELDCRLTRVVVCDLVDGTFYARMYFRQGDRLFSLDARPSDAIAMALRYATPIYVQEKVMEEAAVAFTDDQANNPVPKHEPNAAETLREKLCRAIAEENYESAAHIRDEINKLETDTESDPGFRNV